MNIDRDVEQGGIAIALHRLDFVLDEIEKLNFKADKFFMNTWGKRLTYEEIIGALVSAEQSLKKIKQEKI